MYSLKFQVHELKQQESEISCLIFCLWLVLLLMIWCLLFYFCLLIALSFLQHQSGYSGIHTLLPLLKFNIIVVFEKKLNLIESVPFCRLQGVVKETRKCYHTWPLVLRVVPNLNVHLSPLIDALKVLQPHLEAVRLESLATLTRMMK